MAEERLTLSELMEKARDGDFLRTVAEGGAAAADGDRCRWFDRRWARSGDRTTWHNGHRDRVLDTRLGSLQLRIPKLRQGSYFPPFLEARKVSEKALIAVIQEAWIGGVSTRRVDELVQAMGLSGISKSQSLPPRRRGFPGCAKTSTSVCTRSLTVRSPASGRICGWTRLT